MADYSRFRQAIKSGEVRWYYMSECKPCMAGRRRRSVANQPHRTTFIKLRDAGTMISYDEVDLIVKSQNGLCAICQKVLVRPCLDHDHKTMRPRGILCQACNTGLGNFLDDPVLLRRAIGYLRSFQPQKSLRRFDKQGS